MSAPAAEERRRISYEDFLAAADEDVRAEWVDGEVVETSPASERHQRIARFLSSVLQLYAESHGLGEVLDAPFQMKPAPDLPGREPDVLFVAAGHRERLRGTFLDGPADLVVEIVSPESQARDRGEKFYEYERGGVREYWLVDPLREQAEVYALGARGVYEARGGGGARLESSVMPGLWIEPAWLWGEPMPQLLWVAKQWGLV